MQVPARYALVSSANGVQEEVVVVVVCVLCGREQKISEMQSVCKREGAGGATLSQCEPVAEAGSSFSQPQSQSRRGARPRPYCNGAMMLPGSIQGTSDSVPNSHLQERSAA